VAALAASGPAWAVPFCTTDANLCDTAAFALVNAAGVAQTGCWQVTGGAWFLNDGLYTVPDTEVPNALAVSQNRAFGDVTLTAAVRSPDTGSFSDYALVLNYQDHQNFYWARFNKDSSRSGIYRMSAGSSALVVAAPEATLGSDNAYHEVRFARAGQKLTMTYVKTPTSGGPPGPGDLLVIEATDPNLAGVGGLGFASHNDSAYFDDVAVLVPVSPQPDGGTGGGPGGEEPPPPGNQLLDEPGLDTGHLKGCGCGGVAAGELTCLLLLLLVRRRRG
jgi:hypothetical protein